MSSLVEFMELTKGIEYLIAIAFVFAFIAFWQLVQHRGRGLLLKIIPVAVLALGFGGLASTCVRTAPVATTAPSEKAVPLLASGVLAEMYGPASFDHGLHQRIAKDCAVCHHHSGVRTPPCKECHGAPFKPGGLNKPGLARVYHLQCISCHKESRKGPTDCTGCHTKSAIPPLPITHPLSGVEDCLRCHKAKIPGVPEVPADHAGATNGVCQLCHEVSVRATALATREVPHKFAGLEDCLLCHGEGIGGAGKVPADHAGRTKGTCQLCHKAK